MAAELVSAASLFRDMKKTRSILLSLCLLAAATAAWGKPARVVSMNLCSDELLVRLAEPANIRSVTWLSQNPQGSDVADLARAFQFNRGLAEEVISHDPDLVLAGKYTTRMTVAMIKRIGFPVVELDVPASMEDVKSQIRRMGAVLGEERRADALVASIERQLQQLPPPATANSPTAFVFRPNGFTVGKGSLVNDLLHRAGLRNMAAEMGWESYGQVPVEVIVRTPPDFIILDGEPRNTSAIAYEVINHPALKSLPRTRVIYLPTRLWACAGPELVRAIEIMAEAARQK